MIGRLTGRVVADEGDVVVLEVQGVGYEVTVPLGTLGRVPSEAGAVTLFVHTHVREDALALFGFATDADRAAFRILISIASVGPRTAVAVLSALPAGDLAQAVTRKDLGKLTQIPGIGKKTAERLVLELEGKLRAAPGAPLPQKGAPAVPAGSNAELLLGALTRMGYRPAEAERTVAALGARIEDLPLAEALREALAALAK